MCSSAGRPRTRLCWREESRERGLRLARLSLFRARAGVGLVLGVVDRFPSDLVLGSVEDMRGVWRTYNYPHDEDPFHKPDDRQLSAFSKGDERF